MYSIFFPLTLSMASPNYATPLEPMPGVVLPKVDPFDLNSTTTVRGYDFSNGTNFDLLFQAFKTTGFQATNFGLAVDELNAMLKWRLSDAAPLPHESDEELDPEYRKKARATIFLGYTSNLVSAGTRETIKYLVKNKMIDCLVTTAGGIEEDFMKCLVPHYMGDFYLDGCTLRLQGMNRIGNLLVPNDNYVTFEKWIMPILEAMYQEQVNEKKIWSPSSMIDRFGKEINNEDSIYYWAHKNKIPVYSPAITDGSIGDMITMFSFQREGFICDIASDARALNMLALSSKYICQFILGGGVPKHHIFNASLFGGGAARSVIVSTAQEYDGSDSGARPDESKSWGKIKRDATPVKLFGDATILFPLLVSQTFAKNFVPRE